MHPRCHLALIASKKKNHICPALPNKACRGRKKKRKHPSVVSFHSVFMKLPVNDVTRHLVEGAASSLRHEVTAAGFEPTPSRSIALTDWLIGATVGGEYLGRLKWAMCQRSTSLPATDGGQGKPYWSPWLNDWYAAETSISTFTTRVQSAQSRRTLSFISLQTLGLHFDTGHQKK